MEVRRLAVCLMVAAIGWVTNNSAALGQDVLISNVTVISPEREAPSEPTNVLVREGRIAGIGHERSLDAHGSGQVIDGTGRYLAPGLIDGHTHLSEIPGMTYRHEVAHPDIARAARRQIPRSYLFHGFTTVIDLIAQPDVIAEWNRQDVRPHAHFCGAAPVFDGYPMNFIPKPLRYRIMPYFLFDEARADAFPDGFEPAEHTPKGVVERMHGDGAVCVKTVFERGFGGRRHLPVPTKEMIRDLVAAAHARGMPVLLHANSQSAQAFGVEAGVDVLAHGMWNWADRKATELNPEVTRILDAIVQRNIVWQPTIQVLYGERDLHDPDYLSSPEFKHVLPWSLIDWYGTREGQWLRDRMRANPRVARALESGGWRGFAARPIARVTAALSYLASNGGRLSFGSDTPSSPTYANPPGLNGRQEMRRWLAAGVTPAQLFRAATIVNAEIFGLRDVVGTVEVGKRADLLLLARNPMEDVAAYDEIVIVILAGRVLHRADLSAKAAR
ncbi:MAG: amidohydrolase family protein [Deltaproteobacteria bacterium]|nr:amidohydrolase family protein [Deltaproteobacteria bacterium]